MKFVVTWDAGFGEVATVIDATDIQSARDYAHSMALDQFESNALWGAKLVEEVAERELRDEARQVVGTE